MMAIKIFLFLFFYGLIFINFETVNGAYNYYGTLIGSLSQLHHGVSGDVYAVDPRTIFLHKFKYDGEGPAAYFYLGSSGSPSNNGAIRLRDEAGNNKPLRRYRGENIVLTLPDGKVIPDFRWFSVWCDDFSVNFGDVRISNNLQYPQPRKLQPLVGIHGISSENVIVVDAQTLLIQNFSFDGEPPDAKFWAGYGSKPTSQGIRIPNENGEERRLRKYHKESIVLTLPKNITVLDIDHFGVWCEEFAVDFGHITIPKNLLVPPSLQMLGISPQSKLNCEVLYDTLAYEVRWAVAGESIVIQVVAKLDENEYMSFGVSPNIRKTEMIGADVVVAWVDKNTRKGYANDYYLDAKSQCSGNRGSCPDINFKENSNSVRLLNAALVNGYSIVTYQRSLKPADQLDLAVYTNLSQAIVWAIGPLNERSEVSFHSKYNKGDVFIDFGRQPKWNCPLPEKDESSTNNKQEYHNHPQTQRQTISRTSVDRRGTSASLRHQNRPVTTTETYKNENAWEIPPIQCYEPEDGVFYAQMGPTGGKHGYPAITGHVGWGISWYINGLLIPEINVVRGKTYTFVVEGGIDPEIPAQYHPFYITDDPVGGYLHKTDEEKSKVKLFAGVHKTRSGQVIPTGIGRLCNWVPDTSGPSADEYISFGAYQRTLKLKCNSGEPGIITWTPNENTPDTVYYQCFTHRYLGWKINVHDNCDIAEGTEIDEVYEENHNKEIIGEASIKQETRILPSENFLKQHDKDLIKNHNMKGSYQISYDVSKSNDITQMITDGIRAAENLEEKLKQSDFIKSRDQPKKINSYNSYYTGGTVFRNQSYKNPELYTNNKLLPKYMMMRVPSKQQFNLPMQLRGRRPSMKPYETASIAYSKRQYQMPQPSIISNHYKRPTRPINRSQTSPNPSIASQITSVLLLGETTELDRSRPKRPQISQSYTDFIHHQRKKDASILNVSPLLKNQKPILTRPLLSQKPIIKSHASIFPKLEIMERKELPFDRSMMKNRFQPHNLVVESGFKPILREQKDNNPADIMIQRRHDNDVDMKFDEEYSNYNTENEKTQFEPIFVPSPLDNSNASKALDEKLSKIQIQQTPADYLTEMDIEEGDDKMAVAAEHLDTFYLPSNNQNESIISLPDGPVISYDGKTVLDTFLVNTAQKFNHKMERSSSLSKTENLVSKTPQFGPFQGEVPPLAPTYLPQISQPKEYKLQSTT